MALSDRWTLNALTTACQVELTDMSEQWWDHTELQNYLEDWQATLQSQFEFIWGTATVTTALATLTLSNVASDMLRLDAIYFVPGTGAWGTNTIIRRLSPRSKFDLEAMMGDWRTAGTLEHPQVSYQDDNATVSFWPPPVGTSTFIFEYPRRLTFGTAPVGTETMSVPAWTRYTAVPYVTYRAISRFGPNQDIGKATRYRRKHDVNMKRLRKFYDRFFPDRAEMLRPGRTWASNILTPRGTPQIRPSGPMGG